MATTIKNNDLFITERSESNYSVPAEDLRDFVGVFEPGTKLLFNNVKAPMGWVNIANSNTNLTALRVVKTGGGTTGGSGSFNTAFGTHAIKASKHKHAVTENNHNHSVTLAGHDHGVNDPGHSHTLVAGRAAQQIPTDNTSLSLSNIEEGDTSLPYGFDSRNINSATTGISINSNSTNFTSGNNTALNISVNNAGSSVNWDFNIKYNDFIICQKSNY